MFLTIEPKIHPAPYFQQVFILERMHILLLISSFEPFLLRARSLSHENKQMPIELTTATTTDSKTMPPSIVTPRNSSHAREQLVFGFVVGVCFVLAINHSFSWFAVWKSSDRSEEVFTGRPKVILIGDSITEYGFSLDGKLIEIN